MGRPTRVTQCLHAFCNAHRLRELTAITKTIPSRQWATNMSALLWETNAQVDVNRAQGLAMLPAGAVERLQDCYDAILTAAEATTAPSPASQHPRARQAIPRLQPHRPLAGTPR